MSKKRKVISFVMIIVLLMLASVNTSALTIVEETHQPIAGVTFDETPAPTVNATIPVAPTSTPTPTPTVAVDYYIPFKIDQKKLYPEKATITGTVGKKSVGVKIIIDVNGIEYKTIVIPKGEDGDFSVKVDFSYDEVGDEVVFTSYSSEEFSFPYRVSFKLERKSAKTSKKSKAIKLNKKKVTLKVGKKAKLKLKGAKKSKVKWSCNKKKIAKVRKGIVKAKKPGKCKVIAKYLGKKYKCVVNVIKQNKKDENVLNAEDVVLQLEWKDDNYKTAVLKIVNNSNQEIMTGYGGITLQKFTTGKWENVAVLDTAPPVPSIAVIIKPKKEWSETISISEYFGDLSSGDYVLSKGVYANGKEVFPNIRFAVPSNVPAITPTSTNMPVATATPTPDITPTQYPKDNFMPGEVLVGTKEAMTADEFIKLFPELEIESVSAKPNFANDPAFESKRFYVILKDKTKSSVAPAIEIIKQNPLVEYAEPNYIFYLASAEELDFHGNTLFEISTKDADIVIPEEYKGKKVLRIQLDSDYSNVKTISIPKTIEKIVPYEGDFYDFYFQEHYFKNLVCINVDVENKVYGSYKGMLYKKSNKTLLVCPAQFPDEEVRIPDNIEVIKQSAFSHCANICTIKIGNNVKKIKRGAFSYVPNLEKISIKGSVKKIPRGAFRGCTDLKEVKLHKGIESISKEAFKGCKSLKKVVVPKGTKVAKKAFPKKCKVIRK